jgi:hypothetical protein
MGLRAGLDRWGKLRLYPGFGPRTVDTVASRYTDYAMPAPYLHPLETLNIITK